VELASGQKLTQLQNLLQENITQYGKGLGSIGFGFKGGYSHLETWAFPMTQGVLLVGLRRQRNDLGLAMWISLQEELPEGGVSLTFKLTIPDEPTRRYAAVYAQRGNLIEVLHKGGFTAGGMAISQDTFFDYYGDYPGEWPVAEGQRQRYLILHTFDLERMWYRPFYHFVSNLSRFAEYVKRYKKTLQEE
jgi:hypothetical protein